MTATAARLREHPGAGSGSSELLAHETNAVLGVTTSHARRGLLPAASRRSGQLACLHGSRQRS